jgi:hypothetical protein
MNTLHAKPPRFIREKRELKRNHKRLIEIVGTSRWRRLSVRPEEGKRSL